MWRQIEVLAIGLVVLVTVGVRVLRNARETGRVRLSSQLLVGVLCGGVGALVAAVPHGDTVPDGLETPVAVVTLLVVLAFVGATARPRRPPPKGRRVAPPPRRVERRLGPGPIADLGPGSPRYALRRARSRP